ncbi:MAG TPA: fatty acyl-AMP ligase [Acidimicrobiales bacterium]|nr:fatty acyl-AMP ligase [Acidimicrobiales bacterium]
MPTRIAAAAARGTVTFVGAGAPEPVSWAGLHADARAMAAGLQRRGVDPGDHVALLGPTSRPLVTAIQATWLAGAAVVVLPLPMRLGSIEEFVAQTRARVLGADAKLVLVDSDLAAFLAPEEGDPPMVMLDELAGGGGDDTADAGFTPPEVDPTSLAILQFTSGSTSDPKGVMLPHAQVCANLDAIASAAELVDDDVLVSWLPLYHDMGLIGLLTLAMTTGTDLVLAAPQDFMASPARWMQWMSDFGGTATAGPNFSYALAARALRRMEGLDLSRWRVGLNGAEPIDPAAVEAFCDAGARHGLDPRSVFCAFGMAEATLAVTFPEPMAGMRTDCVDLDALEADRVARPVALDAPSARRLARLGTAVPGIEIRIIDPSTGTVLPERGVGELEIRGTSVTTGYYRRPELDDQIFHEGWLRTGDLAYLVDDELVVCGRIKDVIIVGGRNLFPEDVERAVADVDGVRAGNVIAFGVDRGGKEGLVVVAETKSDDHGGVRNRVAERIRSVVGLGPKEIVLVQPGTLPKTSSGKLQRSLCRTRYLTEALAPA